MKIHLVLLVILLTVGGCKNTESLSDPRPPLMNTNSFASFVPYTNDVEDLDTKFERLINELTNNVSSNAMPAQYLFSTNNIITNQ
jgi:hypothetical protein